MELRFPGQVYDSETQLHYNWNRYYDPRIGRYITSDPIGLEGGLNTFGYVGGNPGKYTDSTGLFFPAAAGGAAGGTATGTVAAAGAAGGTSTRINWNNPKFWPTIPTINWPFDRICTMRGVCIPLPKPESCPIQKREDDGSKEAGNNTNKQPKNWNKHTKPRPGRQSERKRQHPNWQQNPNKKK